MAKIPPKAKAAAAGPGNTTFMLKVSEWFEVQRQLAELGARERTLRLEVAGQAFPGAGKGTHRLDIGHGKDLRAVNRVNYRVDAAAMKEASADIPQELFHAVVKFKPEIAAGPWNAMSDNERKLFGSFVTETPGMPALEIVNVKG